MSSNAMVRAVGAAAETTDDSITGMNCHDVIDDGALRQQANQQIRAAMVRVLYPQKEAFLEACERAPELVATESDPLLFFKFENYNAEAAARRLARYWELRKLIYGGDKAFLPMDLSGHGALSHEDIALFRTGWLLHLPNDQEHRTVLYSDGSKKQKTASNDAASRRIAFFAMQTSFNRGLVWLVNTSNPSAPPPNTNINLVARLARELPIHLHKIHMICSPPGGTHDESPLRAILAQKEEPMRQNFGKDFEFHVASSTDDCLVKLSFHGLSKERLPVIFGGSWTGCMPWRTAANRELTLGVEPDVSCLIRNTLWYFNHAIPAVNEPGQTEEEQNMQMLAASRRACLAKAKGQRGVAATENADADAETKKKKSEMHAIYEKKRREKEKIEIEVMQQQYWRLKNMNESLKRESVRLEGLLQAANDATGHQG